MKKIYYLVLICLSITYIGYSQDVTIARQSFEGLGNYDYVAIPPSGTTDTGVTWGKTTGLGTLAGYATGATFWALNNPKTNPTTSLFSLAFEKLTIGEYEDVEISFDYFFESTAGSYPTAYAALNIDGTVYYITETFLGNSGSKSITIELNDYELHPTPAEVTLSIGFNYNVGPPPYGNSSNLYTDANIGIDNFKVKGNIAGFSGYVFSDGTWSDKGTPANTATSEATDAIIVDGSYDFSGTTKLKSLTIAAEGEASIALNAELYLAGNLVVDDNLIINSTSSTYGSLFVNGTSTGSITYNLWVTNALISAPVYGESFGAFAARNAANLATVPGSETTVKEFGPFLKNPGSYLRWDSLGNSSEILERAEGYRAATKSTSDNMLSFKGAVQTATMTRAVERNAAGSNSQWNLIGNPFTTYLQIDEFVTTNLSKLENGKGGIYGYNGTNWTVYNASSTAVMAPGQGFYIATQLTSTTMEFNRNMRILSGGDDFITGREDSPSHLSLNLSNSTEEKHSTDIYFNENTTLGMDEGYDTTIYGINGSGFTMFTQLIESNPNYKLAIQTMPKTALDIEGTAVALGVIAPKGQQITIDIKENSLNSSATVYLEDTKTNTWTTLTDKAYTFTTDEALNGLGRFILHVADANRLSIIDENELESLQFITGNKSIKIKGLLEKDTNLTVYDIQGRKITNYTLNNSVNEYTVNTSNYSSGIYIVRVQKQNGKKLTKRVILK